MGCIQCLVLQGPHGECSLRKAALRAAGVLWKCSSVGRMFAQPAGSPGFHPPHHIKPGVRVCTLYSQHPGRAWVQGHVQPHSKFQDSLGYRTLCSAPPSPKKNHKEMGRGRREGRRKKGLSSRSDHHHPLPLTFQPPSPYL